ncbi:hypothetical protein [Elioraea tepidiphila]|uniref:hypothetical protein n=1 Tax=Elioraea tepidiphila TaxID=457934 RepID=UPI0012EC5779|nr:hypothetical protein [Elioraea tepidiphila]
MTAGAHLAVLAILVLANVGVAGLFATMAPPPLAPAEAGTSPPPQPRPALPIEDGASRRSIDPMMLRERPVFEPGRRPVRPPSHEPMPAASLPQGAAAQPIPAEPEVAAVPQLIGIIVNGADRLALLADVGVGVTVAAVGHTIGGWRITVIDLRQVHLESKSGTTRIARLLYQPVEEVVVQSRGSGSKLMAMAGV